MTFQKEKFISSILNSRRRLFIPVMTTPGMELASMKPADVFKEGSKQFECIRLLAETFPVDAHLTFMDLSVEAEAFGCKITFSEYENPTVSEPLANTDEAIQALAVPEVGVKRTGEFLKCARLCAQHLEKPVFSGMIGPYTLAGRIADMTEMMILAAAEPETAHALLRKATDFLKKYIRAIKETGVAGVMIAEPAAGLISPEMCDEFSSQYLKEIIAEVKDGSFMVILHNCGKTEKQISSMLSTGADALHVGNAVKMTDILPQVPPEVPVMGNLDPVGVLRNMPSPEVEAVTEKLLEETGRYPNFVLSSGCDLPPGIPPQNIHAVIRKLQQYNQKTGEGK